MNRRGLMIGLLGFFFFAQAARADWAPAKRLTWNSGASKTPAAVVDTWGNIHVVWADDTPIPGSPEIYYKKSVDGGTIWSANRRLTWNSGKSTNPSIGVGPSGGLHVFWQDDTPGSDDIYYLGSPDGGSTWTTAQRISWTAAISQAPAVAVDSWGHIHLVWQDEQPGNCEIYHKSSANGGADWSKNQRLTWTAGWSGRPAMAVDAALNPHVVWSDESPGNSEIYYKDSPDGGGSWSNTRRLTWSSGNSQAPAFAVSSSGVLHLAWWDNSPGNAEIYYKKSTTGGVAWNLGKRLTWGSAESQGPAIAVDSSGNVRLLFWDGQPGNAEIYYAIGAVGGASWTRPARLTWTSGNSYGPAMAVDYLGNLHAVWYDDTLGNYELFYRKFMK